MKWNFIRTAADGPHGQCKERISLATYPKKEVGRIGQIERMLKRKSQKILVPNGDEVCQKKLLDLVHKRENTLK